MAHSAGLLQPVAPPDCTLLQGLKGALGDWQYAVKLCLQREIVAERLAMGLHGGERGWEVGGGEEDCVCVGDMVWVDWMGWDGVTHGEGGCSVWVGRGGGGWRSRGLFMLD